MIRVTDHAVARYRERVKPALDFEPAKRELLALVAAAGEPQTIPPEFASYLREHGKAFLELADGIVAVIDGRNLTTIVIRSSSSPEHRRARRAEKRRAQAKRRWRNNNHGRGNRGFGKSDEWAF